MGIEAIEMTSPTCLGGMNLKVKGRDERHSNVNTMCEDLDFMNAERSITYSVPATSLELVRINDNCPITALLHVVSSPKQKYAKLAKSVTSTVRAVYTGPTSAMSFSEHEVSFKFH